MLIVNALQNIKTIMEIKNHFLITDSSNEEIIIQESPNHSGEFINGRPDTIIIHYTAGGSAASSADWLCNPEAKASAHLVIGKEGELIQLLPFNKIAWHAGRSQWNARNGLNKYSIGIEIANAGPLEKRANGYFTSFGKAIAPENVVLAVHKNGGGERAWEAYTEAQIAAVEKICSLLKQVYQIKEILGHDDIAPARKKDPGPAFPLSVLQNKIIIGRKDEEVFEQEKPLEFPLAKVNVDFLNIRLQASSHSMKVAEPLQKGSPLKILETKGDWYKVRAEVEGWVSAKYVERVD